jgi:pantetheine-phosphate adenylyltransferase
MPNVQPRTAVYPGSFDPVTNGHLDVIERACRIFDRVIVAVAHNEQKAALLAIDERMRLISTVTAHLKAVEIATFDGLLVEFARNAGASTLIRGLRAVSDFEYEFQMAQMNRRLAPEIETLFLTPSEETSYLSSRLVKEIARLGGEISPFVPPPVAKTLKTRFATTRRKSQTSRTANPSKPKRHK